MRVCEAQLSASAAVNRELLMLYWEIGRDILSRQAPQEWGSKIVAPFAEDLRVAFPEMKGFSKRNLLFMRQLAQMWPDEAIVKQRVSLLPWGHNIRLMQKVADPEARLWCLQKAVEHEWSRDMLVNWIDSDLHARARVADLLEKVRAGPVQVEDFGGCGCVAFQPIDRPNTAPG